MFADVPNDHVYFDAVEYAYDMGISNGMSENMFGVDAPISMNAVCLFSIRAFMPELESSETFKSAFEALSDLEYIPRGLKASSSVDFATGLLIIGRVAGVFPVGMYASQEYSKLDAYRYTKNVAKELGIMDISDTNAGDQMTRGQAVYIIYALCEWLSLFETQELSKTERYGFNYIDIRATNDYQNLLPQLHASVFKLPFVTLKYFHDLNFHVEADNQHIDEYNAKNKGIKAIGLFSSAKRTIWTVVGDSLPHEMGHFTHFVIMVDRASIKPIYTAEKDNLSSLVPIYAKVNSDEFFAEFFGVYVSNQDNPENLMKLKADMPKTFDYFEMLKEANWATASSVYKLAVA